MQSKRSRSGSSEIPRGLFQRLNISDSDAFEVRTTLRLNIALGGPPLEAAPVYNEPLK